MFDEPVKTAKDLLAEGGVRSCIYACLELRFAIEKHVYNKINFYSKRYGKKQLFSKWQPNKALKILCQLEPLSDQSYELSFSHEKEVGKPSGNWKPLGKHEALDSKWVTKHYNKLSSYLHMKPSGEPPDVKELRSYLDEIILELERVESSTLLSDLSETASFICSVCKEKIVCSISSLSNLPEVVCSNMNCNATYLPSQDKDGNWGFTLNSIKFICPDCEEEKNILKSELQIDAGWKCKNCGSKFQIVGNTWNYIKK